MNREYKFLIRVQVNNAASKSEAIEIARGVIHVAKEKSYVFTGGAVGNIESSKLIGSRGLKS